MEGKIERPTTRNKYWCSTWCSSPKSTLTRSIKIFLDILAILNCTVFLQNELDLNKLNWAFDIDKNTIIFYRIFLKIETPG